jgi:hypothetical protein
MKYFFRAYCISLSLLLPILYAIHKSELHKGTLDLSIWSVVMFSVISFSAYFVVTKVAKSVKQQFFISLTMTNTLIKMVSSVVILVVYKQMHAELNRYFAVPFLVIYVTFTIFETTVLLNAANQKPS